MRALALLALGLRLALAGPESAAAPERWSDVRGTPAGGFASRARPVVRDPVQAWSIRLPGRAMQAPLLWRGLAYLLCADGAGRTLVAVDIYLGEVVAKKTLAKDLEAQLAVWNGVVLLNNGGKELLALRRSKKTFRRIWRSRPGRFTDPVFWQGDIYVVNAERLECWKLGQSKPRWSAGGGLRGRPAVLGSVVYAVGHVSQEGYLPQATLFAFHRKTGGQLAQALIGYYADNPGVPPGPEASMTIVAGASWVFVKPPRPIAGRTGRFTIVAVPQEITGGRPVLGQAGLFDWEMAPSLHKGGTIYSQTRKGVIGWIRMDSEGKVHPITSTQTHPLLMRRRVPPVILGDVVYFGHWAADIRSREVLWRLEKADVRLPATPADGMVLLIEGERTLLALKERGEE